MVLTWDKARGFGTFSCQGMSKWYEKEVIPKSLTTHATAAQALSPSLI